MENETVEVTKTLSERLKERGLNVAEEAIAEIVKEIFVMGREEVNKMDAGYKGLILMALPEVEKLLLSLVDKLDGEDDANR